MFGEIFAEKTGKATAAVANVGQEVKIAAMAAADGVHEPGCNSTRKWLNLITNYIRKCTCSATSEKNANSFLSHSNILQHFDPKHSQERTRYACQAA